MMMDRRLENLLKGMTSCTPPFCLFAHPQRVKELGVKPSITTRKTVTGILFAAYTPFMIMFII
jgi:hypothetical protein